MNSNEEEEEKDYKVLRIDDKEVYKHEPNNWIYRRSRW